MNKHTVGSNKREMDLLKELMSLVEIGACSDRDADRASAIICRDVSIFNVMDVSEAADMALELARCAA